jgi:hypothetical protein
MPLMMYLHRMGCVANEKFRSDDSSGISFQTTREIADSKEQNPFTLVKDNFRDHCKRRVICSAQFYDGLDGRQLGVCLSQCLRHRGYAARCARAPLLADVTNEDAVRHSTHAEVRTAASTVFICAAV